MKTLHVTKRILTVLLSVILLFHDCMPIRASEEDVVENPLPDAYYDPVATDLIEGWPQGPSVWAESAVVMDLDSNVILYSKNMDSIKYPASITKILTALIVIENTLPYERVTFSKNAVYGIEPGSSHIGIREGEILSIEECLHGILLESANEVCLAVAEHVAGSVSGFVDMMNERVKELGCKNTHFTNPNGLPDEDHYTTAYDMALISAAAYKNPMFRQIISTSRYTIPYTNLTGEKRWLCNHHKMLPEGKYAYEGCTGGKTGFTNAAWNTLVTFAERNGRKLVCVSLRTNGSAMTYQDTASLLDYGFNNFQNISMYTNKDCLTYPSLFFDPSVRLSCVRPDATITIPAQVSVDNVTVSTDHDDVSYTRTYVFNTYTVGQENISSESIKKFLISRPYHPVVVSEESARTDDHPSALQKGRRILKPFLIVLCVLLALLLVMELLLAYKRALRKKRRRERLLRKKQMEQRQQHPTHSRRSVSAGTSDRGSVSHHSPAQNVRRSSSETERRHQNHTTSR